MDRSGAGFDIDQRTKGGSISITGSTFTNCGKPASSEGYDVGSDDVLTSGAIKIKVRFDKGDKTAAFDSVEIIGNTFSGNRADIVLGTDNVDAGGDKRKTYPDTLAKETTIKNNTPAAPILEDNSGNDYSIDENGKLAAAKG